jgi:superfamily II DNA or RNA helicase
MTNQEIILVGDDGLTDVQRDEVKRIKKLRLTGKSIVVKMAKSAGKTNTTLNN